MLTSQLVLPVRLNDTATFQNFLSGSQQPLVTYLQALAAGKISDQLAYLWGKPATGRSHLLQAACHHAHSMGLTAGYISLANLNEWSVQALQGLEHYQLLCIDDIDSIAGSQEWQEGLFHLYNRQQATTTNRLIISANLPPTQLGLSLADLVSRLTAAAVFQLQPATDSEKLAILQFRARLRGLELTSEVGRYIINRYYRDLSALIKALQQLDDESLAAQRKLTIPFVKAVLSL